MFGAYGSSKVFIPNSTGDTRKLSEFEAAITQLPLDARYASLYCTQVGATPPLRYSVPNPCDTHRVYSILKVY